MGKFPYNPTHPVNSIVADNNNVNNNNNNYYKTIISRGIYE